MKLDFPFKYAVRTGAGPVQRGSDAVQASNGREARILAAEKVIRLCGSKPLFVEVAAPR